jgi:hypothetical protein
MFMNRQFDSLISDYAKMAKLDCPSCDATGIYTLIFDGTSIISIDTDDSERLVRLWTCLEQASNNSSTEHISKSIEFVDPLQDCDWTIGLDANGLLFLMSTTDIANLSLPVFHGWLNKFSEINSLLEKPIEN